MLLFIFHGVEQLACFLTAHTARLPLILGGLSQLFAGCALAMIGLRL